MAELKFDRARFDGGEMPTRTRNGHKVLHVHDSGLDVGWPIVAWVEGLYAPGSYTSDGKLFGDDRESGLDLVHEPRMLKVRVLVYRMTDGGIGAVSEDEVGDFDRFCSNPRAEGRVIHLLEVEVPE